MEPVYQKADMGAKSAWKGYSSQTLYIAHRIASDSACQVESEYYPEHIEDLLIKQNGAITEVVQVKDLAAPLSLSSLASTKDSKSKTGFFHRACSLMEDDVKTVRVVYFGEMGVELADFQCEKSGAIKAVQQKLVDNHGLSSEEATWLSKTLVFEKVEHRVLKDELISHLSTTVPTMSFPELAFSLLTQHVADLSQIGGFTSIPLWQDKILSIGHSIAAVDGFYKEYGKSLIRLSEFATDETADKLSEEYKAGVSAHPEHIRMGLDFIREYWINAIEEKINKHDIIVVKGASGQGKTSLCLRYLMNHCPEDLVFCVRHAKGSTQINNLARSISEISRYTSDMMLYIDVYPGEYEWPKLLLELKALGTNIPILVSIREEDFKQSNIDYAAISIKLVELDLTEKEAEIIYKNYTENEPHPIYRSFIEAWGAFGGKGPFMEFVYLLNNNQTLFDRLQSQIKQLMLEEHPDSWFVLLSIVCYAGRVGCAVLLSDAVHVSGCDASISALNRMTNEYLIKTTDDNKYLEALHPVRAKAICEILTPDSPLNVQELFSSTIRCVNHRGLQLLVMDYFTYNPHHPDVINALLALPLRNWTTAAAVLRSLLWVSTKEYYETNQSVFQSLLEKRGDGWMMFSPMDISGLLSPGKLIMESVVDSMPESSIDKNAVRKEIDETKDSLSSFTIDYSQVDKWIGNAQFPECHSETDMDWDDFSYVLYWCAQRKRIIDLPYIEALEETAEHSPIESGLNAYFSISLHNSSEQTKVFEILKNRIQKENRVIIWNDSSEEITCKFVPPLMRGDDTKHSNFNNFWRIRMCEWLFKLYPQYEKVNVELVGIDILQDLGISATDHIAHIQRDKLPSAWVTEINSWLITRVNYSFRPTDWKEYLESIQKTRQSALDCIMHLVKVVEFLYTKQRLDKKRNDDYFASVEAFEALTKIKLLLPIIAVDPYGTVREDSKAIEEGSDEDGLHLSQSQYIMLYNKFSKSFGKTVSDFGTFLNFAPSVIMGRYSLKEFDEEDRRKATLSSINLFSAAKALYEMQKEYKKLFTDYSDDSYAAFEEKETERYQVLLNMWAHIVQNPPRKIAIEYPAKLRYRKAAQLVDSTITACINRVGGTPLPNFEKQEKTIFYTMEFDPLTGQDLNNRLIEAGDQFKDALKLARGNGSERWYLETNFKGITVVPLIEGIPMSTAFLLPVYRLINDSVAFGPSLFPSEVPDELYDAMELDYSRIGKWNDCISALSVMALQINQYNSVVDIFHEEDDDHVSLNGVQAYAQDVFDKLGESLAALDFVDDFLRIASIAPNEVQETQTQLEKTIHLFEDSSETISDLKQLTPHADMLTTTVSYMMFLTHFLYQAYN